MCIAKANLAVAQAEVVAPATCVVAKLNETHKVAKERALAAARQ